MFCTLSAFTSRVPAQPSTIGSKDGSQPGENPDTQNQTQNHELVYKLANEMIERVGIFMERYDAIGAALQKATLEYGEGKKKLMPQGQSIINTSNKLIKLGAKNSERHPVPELVDVDDIPQIDG